MPKAFAGRVGVPVSVRTLGRIYANCMWLESFVPVLNNADANYLPADVAADVKEYVDINFKLYFALRFGKSSLGNEGIAQP